jgi:hypothetical protein
MPNTITELCAAVKSTLDNSLINYIQEPKDLTEGIQDQRVLQIYPESGATDVFTNTDRRTFSAGVRQSEIIINCDYYLRQRAHLGEEMADLLPGIDAIIERLEAQQTKPYFGLTWIKAFSWRWERTTFVYGDAQMPYIGARFILRFIVF